MEAHGITPIVGLVHHGSGPHYTNLLESSFVSGLRDFARAVAERYPRIKYVTPVNEPLTTARFSGLYGHWYPHRRSHDAFVRMLLNQCLAIRDSMAAMREVNPDIQLVQTEDLGRIYSTPSIRYQADYENERRWLTNDLLCGHVHPAHPMWRDLAVDGEAVRDMESLATDPCPPDILGVNYYVTSDRFLDDRLLVHDGENVEGNGRHRYADVEAARVLVSGITGHSQVLTEAWDRYHLPVALTEVHLGCTREHQMRWLAEAWKGACEARARGCDIRAITAWALFGSFGWDSLLTRPPYEYECGAFDINGPKPRETGVARLIRQLVSGGACSEAVATEPGWWQSHERFTIAPYPPLASANTVTAGASPKAAQPILIAGARGTLGVALVRVCRARGVSAVALSRAEMDIADRESVRRAISTHRPWAVINAAGFVRVDDAEEECASCYRANTLGVSVLASECSAAGIRLVTFSSDLVFDGRKGAAYVESDAVSPLSIYGSSKAAAERRALEAHHDALIVRTSAFFGPWDEYNFLAAVLKTLGTGMPFEAASDTVVSPTYVPDLANASLDLLMDGERGVWHLANQGEITWSDLAHYVADRSGLPAGMIRAVPSESLSRRAPQPRYSVLTSEKATLLPTLDNALNRWFSEASLPELRAVTA
jgi:dTDP-4-dehydrorhamnose reductase